MEMVEIIAIMSSRRVFAANPMPVSGSDMGAGRNVVTVKGLLDLVKKLFTKGWTLCIYISYFPTNKDEKIICLIDLPSSFDI